MKTASFIVVLGILLAANILAPQVLRADACCKACGAGDWLGENTRTSEDCNFYCTVTRCSTMSSSSYNCRGGSYQCTDSYVDLCDTYADGCF